MVSNSRATKTVRLACVFRIHLAALSIALLWAHTLTAQTVLLVTNNNGSLTSEETLRQNQFIAWGYTVNTIWDAESQANFDAAFASADVVYVTEEVNSNDLADKLRTATIGVVNGEKFQDDNLGFSTTSGSESNVTNQILVTDNTHPVSSALATGYITIFSSTQPRILLGGTQASSLEVLATGSSGDPVLAVIETGGTLANTVGGNNTALGRRVRLPFGGGSFTFSSLDADGLSIVQNALIWAMGNASTLKGHWILNETSGTTATDSSDSGFDGTYENGVTLGEEGPYPCGDSAAEFDGIDEYVDLPNMNLDYSQGCSFAFWFRPHAVPSSYAALLGISNGQDNDDIWIGWLGASGLEIYLSDTTDGGATRWLDDNLAPTLDVWQHFVGTIDSSGNATIYRDGVEVATGYVSLPDNTNRTENSIGVSVWNDEFEGRLHDVRVYTRELSAGEVSEIYSLIGHWKFDETVGSSAADESGYSNDGALANGPVWTTGEIDGGLQFDGSNDIVTIPNNTELEVGANDADFTVAFWVNLQQGSTGSWRALIHKGASATQRTFAMWMRPSDNRIHFRISTTSSWNEGSNSVDALSVGSWTHVAYVKRGATLELYINGELNATDTLSGQTISNSGPIYLGDDPWYAATACIMDDLRIYNRALCSEEINLLSGEDDGSSLRITRWIEVANP